MKLRIIKHNLNLRNCDFNWVFSWLPTFTSALLKLIATNIDRAIKNFIFNTEIKKLFTSNKNRSLLNEPQRHTKLINRKQKKTNKKINNKHPKLNVSYGYTLTFSHNSTTGKQQATYQRQSCIHTYLAKLFILLIK